MLEGPQCKTSITMRLPLVCFLVSTCIGSFLLAEPPHDLVLKSTEVLENQSVGSIVGDLQGIDDDILLRNSLLHKGYQLETSVEQFLDLSSYNPDKLTHKGEQIFSIGPQEKGLRFLNSTHFKDSGVGIDKNSNFQNLFGGYFRARVDGIYEFRLSRQDDMAAIWIDVDRDGNLEEEERVAMGTEFKTVYLQENLYLIGITQAQTSGGAALEVKFRTPHKDAGPTALTIIQPASPEQDGLWYVFNRKPDDSLTYSLVKGKGDTDNKSFAINGSKLVTKEIFDHEDEDTYSVRVRVQDSSGGTFERSFNITVTNANDAITAIYLDNSEVDENLPVGSLVGELSAEDPDGISTKGLNKGLIAYYPFDGDSNDQTRNLNHGTLKGGARLTEDRNGQDNSALYLDGSGDWVDINGVADDVDRSITMATWIQADPATSGTRRSILAVNSAPGAQGGQGSSNILLLLIGKRSSNPAFTKKFVIFDAITGGYEAMSQTDVADGQWHHVAYTTDGESGNFFVDGIREGSHATDYKFEEDYRWSLGQEFDGQNPSDYLKGLLDDVRIYNRILPDSEIKALYETFTYTLVSGEGDDDNGLFQVVSNILQTASPIDHEDRDFRNIRVRVTDVDGQYFEQSFRIQVTDTNDPPTGLSIDKDTIAENLKKGSTVGNFSVVDPDSGDSHTYSLVKDPGDGFSNDLFSVSGRTLKTAVALDFEHQSAHSLLVSVKDKGGSTYQKELTLQVVDSNDPPTGLALDNLSIPESATSGTSLGTFIVTDPDAGDTHSYKITGGDDKSFFKVQGAGLVTAKALDFEFKDELEVRIRVTDKGGDYLDHDFQVLVTNANDGPTDILLEPASIAENMDPGSLVGIFTQVDPDGEWDPLKIPENAESQDFLVETFPGNKLDDPWTPEFTDADGWDHEVKSGQLNVKSISATVQNTESGGTWGLTTLTRPITPLADFTAEWQISWDQKKKKQAMQKMFLVLLGPNDEEIVSVGINDEWILYQGTKFTSLGGNDYITAIGTMAFKADSDVIKVSRVGSEMDVRWNDWIFATGQSSTPVARVRLTFGTYQAKINRKNSTFGVETVERLHISGIEAPRAPSYELVSGDGSGDNDLFEIQGDRLLARSSFNHEEHESYSIRIRGIDPGGLYLEKAFSIEVINRNDSPSSVVLSNDTIKENLKSGTTVGSLTASDEDPKDKHVFKLPEPEDGGSVDNRFFSISGKNLRSASTFDFEGRSEYRPRIRVTDSGGNVIHQDLLIKVTDGNDAPTRISLLGDSIPEGLSSGKVIGTLSAIDPDPGDRHTYKISGGRDRKSFSISGSQLRSSSTFDRESRPTLEVIIRATDGSKAYVDQAFTITVLNANDPPTAITLSGNSLAENQSGGTLVGTLGTIDPDAIPEIILPLHFHLMEKWSPDIGSSTADNYTSTKDFEGEVLPVINRFFARSRIRFELGRTHRENLTKRFANNAARQDALDALIQGGNTDATLHSLMDPDLREPGSHHLYFFPYVGKDMTHSAMKAHDSHAAVGEWTGNASGPLVKTDLGHASIRVLLQVLGLETPVDLSANGGLLDDVQTRTIRAQAAAGRPVIEAANVPAFSTRQGISIANIPIADKEYHLDLGGNNVWVPYSASHPISQANTTIRRIVLLNQGLGDNLPAAWETLSQVIADEARSENTLLIAPQFLVADQLNDKDTVGLLHWASRDAQLFGGLSAVTTVSSTTSTIGPKIDKYHQDSDYPAYPDKGNSRLVEKLVADMKANPAQFAFLHLTHPDSVGHGHGWGTEKYQNSIKAVDSDLGLLFDLIEKTPALKDDTILLLTADHGGGGGRLYEHTNHTHPDNYTIPFYTWGKGVRAGADLYDLNTSTRTAPGKSENPAYSGESHTQPIRNGAIANLASSLLGLPAVPGSWINAKQDLNLGGPHSISHVITISIDGLRPADIVELGPDELPNFFRFRNEGAFTDNARTDTFITRTLPNHACMLTGRGSLDVDGVGVGHNQEQNHDSGDTLHDNIGAYMQSIFNVAKDGGLRTFLFANKSKFDLLNRTWDGSWKDTGNNNASPRITTFAVVDHILDALTTDKKKFPNLEEVVLAGHGDGADFLQRYAASNVFENGFRKDRKLPVRYVLLAPGTYLHFSRERLQVDGSFAVPATPPDKYNDYPFGLNYLFDYPESTGSGNLLESYPARQVGYLVGGQDSGLTGLDNSPAAEAQGAGRLARAQNFEAYLEDTFGPGIRSVHTFETIPGIGHEMEKTLKSAQAIRQILGVPIPDSDGDGWNDDDERALATDPLDPNETPNTFASSFELVDGEGSTDNPRFRIENGQLVADAPLDHEDPGIYSVRIRVTDPGGATLEQVFPIEATDVNEPPTLIFLDNDSIAENLKKGTRVGRLFASDPDSGDKLTYKLGMDDETVSNELFTIKGTEVRTNAVLDYDLFTGHTIRVIATDTAGASLEQLVSINVADANDPPVNIWLDNSTIPENQPSGTLVGSLSVMDYDTIDSHTYSIVSGADRKLFAVNGDKLVSKATYDFESRSRLEIVVRAYDKKKAYVDVPFTINVTNVNDPPTDILLDNDTIAENEPTGTLVGKFLLVDEDGGGANGNPNTPIDPNFEVGELKWKFEVTNAVFSTPAIGMDGTIYVGTKEPQNRGHLYALDGKTGEVKWKFDPGSVAIGNELFSGIGNAPSIGSDGTVYIPADAQKVFALDGQTGAKKWEFETGHGGTSSPAIGSDGTIYVKPQGGKMYALNGNTGTKLWEFDIPDETSYFSPSIGLDGAIYVTGQTSSFPIQPVLNHKRLFALDGKTGEKIWEFDPDNGAGDPDGNQLTSPAIGFEQEIFIGGGRNLYAINPIDGSKKWSFRKDESGFRGPSLGSDGTLFLGGNEAVYAVDGTSGKLKWKWHYPQDTGTITTVAAIGSDETVYVGTNHPSNNFYALDGKTGQKKWEFDTGRILQSSPVIGSDGTVYIGTGPRDTSRNDSPATFYAIQGSSGPADSPWPMFGQNAQRTGRTGGGPSSFTLVPGKGDDDNTLFTINGDELQVGTPLDYETRDEYSIRVRGTDAGGLSIEKTLTIHTTNINEAPTAISLSKDTVTENLKKGTTVGTLSATDEDASEKHTFRLVDNTDGSPNDNALFYISGTSVRTGGPLDAETTPTLTIRVEATDRNKLTYSQEMVITVADGNDPASGLTIDKESIVENQAAGTEIGTLTALDPDVGDTHTFKIVGGADKSAFEVKDGRLLSRASLDFEDQPELEVIIRVTDKLKAYADFPLIINVIDGNDAPTGLTLDNDHVAENAAAETVVSRLSLEDPDQFSRGMCYWHTSGLDDVGLDLPAVLASPAQSAIVVAKLKSLGVRRLYLNAIDLPIDEPDQVAAFNRLLHGNGIEVQFLYTALNWIKNDSGRAKIEKFLKLRVVDFNNSRQDPTEHFDGVHFDIEPHAMTEWKDENDSTDSSVRQDLMTDYRETVTRCSQYLKDRLGKDFSIFIDIPAWYDNLKDDSQNGSTRGNWWGSEQDRDNWFEGISAAVDGIFLMAYGRKDVDSYRELIQWELDNIDAPLYGGLHFGILSGDEPGIINVSILDQAEFWNLATAIGREIPALNGVDLSSMNQLAANGLDDIPAMVSFTLVAGTGDTDNALFTIDKDELKLAGQLDHETRDEYSIRVKGVDPGGLGIESVLTIYTSNINEAPYPPVLSRNTIPENGKPVTLVGKFTAADPERDKVILSLADEGELLDNGNFQLKGSSLYSSVPFDFETQPSLWIRVIATDPDGLNTSQDMEILVVDVNEASTVLAIDNATIEENLPKDSLVGTLATTDEDAGETFSYLFIKGDGDTDNNRFKLDKSTGALTSKAPFNHEDKDQYSVRVSTTDSGGHSLQQSFAIQVTNVNEPPLSFAIDNSTVRERRPAGTTIGTLTAIDTDNNDTHTFSLVSGQGGTHNDSFQVVGDQLKTTEELDGKSTPEASILLRVTDAGGLTFIGSLAITVTDSPDAPTDLELSAKRINKFERTGTFIGTFTATDSDDNETHAYALADGASGTDNDLFFIDGDQLVSNHMFDDTAASSYKINVEVADSSGLTYQEVFTIKVIDAANPGGVLVNVTKVPPGGGLVTGAGYYNTGEKASLTVRNSPGFTFSGHTGDVPNGFSADNPLVFTVDAAREIISSFTEGYHTVTVGVSPDRHGYAWGGGSILHGTEITVNAKQLESSIGSVFSHWSINGVDLEVDEFDSKPMELKVTVENSMLILAHFNYGLPDTMKLVPAGTFEQGLKPIITPYISAFYIDKYETTKALWLQVYNWAVKNGYEFSFDSVHVEGRNRPITDASYKDQFPITGINWHDGVKWANARSEMEGLKPIYYTDSAHTKVYRVEPKLDLTPDMVDWRGKGYRLPTDSEWEKAARGGVSGLAYTNGNTIDSGFAHYDKDTVTIGKRNYNSITEVSDGVRAPNGYGLYDMAGNAWEMCWDWYWKNWYTYYNANMQGEAGKDPVGATAAQSDKDNWMVRTVRGGEGVSDKYRTKVSYRKDFNITWQQYAITLRPVVAAPSNPYAKLSVNVSPPHLGTVHGTGIYDVGDEAELKATALSGKSKFLRWEDSDGNILSSRRTLDLIMVEDVSVTAVFEDRSPDGDQLFSLLVMAEPFGSGTIQGGGAYLKNTVVTLTAVPSGTNDFAGWAGDASGLDTTVQVTMDGHKNVSAYFGDISRDSDGDGLSDLYEVIRGTDPEDEDTDRDGLNDGDEVDPAKYGSDPLLVDTDGDGFDDKEEVFHGTPPSDPADFPFVPKKNLDLHYMFVGRARDSAEGRHDGKVNDATLIDGRNEKGKNAYLFEADDEQTIEATGYKGVGGFGGRTISIWVHGDADSGGGLITWGRKGKEFEINLRGGRAEVLAGSGTVTGSIDLLDKTWHQVVVSVPEGGTLGDASLYVDGKADPAPTTSGDTSKALATDSNSTLVIGRNSAKEYLDGRIDDTRVWSRALAASEVEKLFALEEANPPPEPETIKPKIITQPLTQTVATGQTVSLSVVAIGKPTPIYKWEQYNRKSRKWVTLSGITGSTYSIESPTLEDSTSYRVTVSNKAGYHRSKTTKLYVLAPPTIAFQPADKAFATGSTITLYFEHEGSPKFQYKWFQDGNLIESTTKNRLSIKGAKAGRHDGTYSVNVKNAVGEVTSNDFQVNVFDKVLVTDIPRKNYIVQGQPGTVKVTAIGGGVLTHQWEKYDPKKKTWSEIQGQDVDTLTIPDMQAEDEGTYRCLVDNLATYYYSKSATITMHVPPVIKTHPRDYSLNEGRKATLSGLATGIPSPTYQWEKLGDDGLTWEPVPKKTKPDLAFSKLYPRYAGRYRLVATNIAGSATTNEATLVVYYKPILTANIASQSINEDDSVTFTVAANVLDSKGTDATYTWYKDKKSIKDGSNGVSGARTAALTIAPAKAVNYGTYYCLVKNGVGTVKSASAKLTVILKPYATKFPLNLSLVEGKSATFSASVKGAKTITYQWQKDGSPISKQTKNKLSLRDIKVDDAGTYSLVATNPVGSLTLDATLTVAAAAHEDEVFNLSQGAKPDLESATSDVDNDGLPDLLEHALGSDPRRSSSTFNPVVDTVQGGNNQYFVSFSYTRNKAASGLTYNIERSSDLKTWEPIDLSTASVSTLDRGTFIEITVYIPATDGSGFFRVRVE